MTDPTTPMDLSEKDRKNLLVALKTLSGQEASKLPGDFSPERLAELHELADRIRG